MKLLLIIGAGSFIGGVLRFLLSTWVQVNSTSLFPYGTFWVNIAGCFALGFIYAIALKNNFSEELKLFLSIGILGGFTTFSAFSLQTLNLIKNSHYLIASMYVFFSVFGGLLFCYLGYLLLKQFLS